MTNELSKNKKTVEPITVADTIRYAVFTLETKNLHGNLCVHKNKAETARDTLNAYCGFAKYDVAKVMLDSKHRVIDTVPKGLNICTMAK